jgi:hypothetical protein
MTATTSEQAQYGLSKRGEKNAAQMTGRAEKLFKVIHNQYDEKHNPEGVGESCRFDSSTTSKSTKKHPLLSWGLSDLRHCR